MSVTLMWMILGLWTAAASVTVRYPDLNGSEMLQCECVTKSCQFVMWFRQLRSTSEFQFLMTHTLLDKALPAQGELAIDLKPSWTGSTSTLRIKNITERDAGFYSCMVDGTMLPGYMLRPGEKPPRAPQPTKNSKEEAPKPKKRPCCSKSSYCRADDCEKMILWPFLGIIAALALTIAGVLFYFSRLPKKCRHNFVKKHQLR
ncbi:uncharacterized protein cd8b isoform X2 [Denticeps clupeoides]|uniref:uncharacterized protein cd8b isoform X2 n=1 Tax=Denticeps clupeoides TaxID=299321 RepID=UPI0010A4B306|nr:uncharacterized protein LOC114786506 isoform X2 [Denticeps clupeoides]